MQTFKIANLTVTAIEASAERICYVLFPMAVLGDWLRKAAQRFDVSIVIVEGMDWDNDLTPWPAPGEPPGSPDFKGNAPQFLSTLIGEVIPEAERRLKIAADARRTLAGVSLAGLFTLWQWMHCAMFDDIISLSGSFWYDGFVDWLESQPVPAKSGKAYFLLGDQEAKTRIKAFQSVQTDTVEVVDYLRRNGITAFFELVPGNHYQYGQQRLERAFSRMFG